MRPLPTRVDLELGFSIVHIVRFPSFWRHRNAFTANHDFPFLVIPCLLRGFFFLVQMAGEESAFGYW